MSAVRHRLYVVYAPANEEWVQGYLVPTLGIDPAEVRLMRDIRPGTVIAEDIEGAIAQSQYVLVVLSKAWETDEWAQDATSLSEHLRVTNRGMLTIPCILEDCTVSLRVQTRQAIDCRDYAQPRSRGAETQAEKGLAELRAMLGLAAPAPAEESIECPYPGMVAFESKELFFGRDDEIQRLVGHVRDHALTVAVGPSGSGKSSLIRAGLIPRLPGTWLVRQVRLLDRPSVHLWQALGVEMADGARLPDLGAAMDALLAGQPPDARVLVVVDPLEELFQLAPADRARALHEQERFRDLLGALARAPRCACVIALRADFFGNLMNSPLWSLAEHNLFAIASLADDALRTAIREPARRRSVSVEPALIEMLIADVRGEPGALPLLQETLRSLWEKRERRLLPSSLYAAMRKTEGGNPLAAILARKAQAALAELPIEDRVLVQPLLLRLVHFGEDERHTRRQQRMADLEDIGNAESVRRVVDHLASKRLLTLTGDGPTRKDDAGVASARVDLAHEAILDAWPTLAQWIRDWREDEQKRRRLEDKAREYVRHDRRGALLDAVALVEAAAWLGSENAPRLGISADLRGLVAASRAALARSRRRRILAESALAMLAVVAGILALVALQQRAEAVRQRDRALQTIRDSRELAKSIVYTADRELELIAGTASAREKLLDVAERLLERLRSADASDVEATRDMIAHHIQRGDLALSHEDLAQARAHYEKALELTRTLVATDPGNALWQNDLSVCYDKLGDVELAAGNLDAARSFFRDGLDVAKKLAAATPGYAEWQHDLAIIYSKLGDVEIATGNLDAARSLFRDGRDIFKKLATADPGNAQWQRDLSVSYERLGDIEIAAGNLDAARALFRDSLDIAKKLAATEPGNGPWQHTLSVCYHKLGDVERAAGNLDAARALFRDGLDIARKLAAADPGNAQWQRDFSASYNRLGDVERAAGNLDAARVLFGDSLDISKKLAAADPGNAGWQRDLIAAEVNLALVEAEAQKPAEVRRHLEAARAVLARLDAAGLLRGDALLEQYRQFMLAFERDLPR
jgi:tetratricopeptide (TPR) repeat protein